MLRIGPQKARLSRDRRAFCFTPADLHCGKTPLDHCKALALFVLNLRTFDTWLKNTTLAKRPAGTAA
jgi:hypothetical protein